MEYIFYFILILVTSICYIKLSIYINHHHSTCPFNVSCYVNINMMVANFTDHKLISPNNLIPAVYTLMTLLFLNAVLFSRKIIAIYSTS
jgi:hypothetical protein